MPPNSIVGMVKNRLRTNIHHLNHEISEEDAVRLARFLLEDLDAARWRLVPVVPTREMIGASMTAMRKRRQREGWVSEWRKHAWRLAAGVEASPHWDVAKPKSSGEQNAQRAGGGETANAPSDVAEIVPPAGLSEGDLEQRMALDTIHRLRQPLPEGWEFDRDGANERR